jgi:hypothetical protein
MSSIAIVNRSLHAGAVGHGIAVAIFAVAREPGCPEEWVHLCITAADEAESAVNESPPARAMGSAERMLRETSEPGELGPEWDEPLIVDNTAMREAARQAGSAAFRACMPRITGRRNLQAYIACVAAGLGRQYFTGPEARAALYVAQIALSAWPRRQQTRGRKEPK